MTAQTFSIPATPPSALLADEVIELRVLRVMQPVHAATRPANEQFLAEVPEYRFAIHRRSDGVRVGRIHVRVTNAPKIVDAIGHSGYAVDEAHRRKGYATRAVRLVVELGRYWNILPLWILIEPGNVASRRTVERAGLMLIEVAESSAEIVALGIGPKVCRYRSGE